MSAGAPWGPEDARQKSGARAYFQSREGRASPEGCLLGSCELHRPPGAPTLPSLHAAPAQTKSHRSPVPSPQDGTPTGTLGTSNLNSAPGLGAHPPPHHPVPPCEPAEDQLRPRRQVVHPQRCQRARVCGALSECPAQALARGPTRAPRDRAKSPGTENTPPALRSLRPSSSPCEGMAFLLRGQQPLQPLRPRVLPGDHEHLRGDPTCVLLPGAQSRCSACAGFLRGRVAGHKEGHVRLEAIPLTPKGFKL